MNAEQGRRDARQPPQQSQGSASSGPASSGPTSSGPAPSVPEVDVQALVAGGREAVILHEGERYRLRITTNRKLILTK